MPPFELSQATFGAFMLQALLLACPIPLSYLVYRLIRAPLRDHIDQRDLHALGIRDLTNLPETNTLKFSGADYAGPVIAATALIFVIYAMTHPYTIGLGLWTGILEEFVDSFGFDGTFTRQLVSGRFLFWGWVGAWVYSISLILRRFLDYDLTPNVYVYVISRFLLAWLISTIVGVSLGMMSRMAGVDPSVNLVTVSTVVFAIGFFPERGLNWINAMTKRALGERGEGGFKQHQLSEIEGLSMWHQARFSQEGIENVQNLAMSNLIVLVVNTPFSVGQIIDWVDQSLLLMYAPLLRTSLRKNGIRCASDFLAITEQEETLKQLASSADIEKNTLLAVRLALLSATNMRIVARFKWQFSTDPARIAAAERLRSYRLENRQPNLLPTATPAKTEADIVAVK